MNTMINLWGALPLADNIFNPADIPPAKADAVNILSLPVEVLELIVEYCPTRSMLPLMLTNRTLFSVALRKLYAILYIHINLKSRDKSWYKPYCEMGILPPKYMRQFGALISMHNRAEYMTSLRELHIIKLWGFDAMHPVICVILHKAAFLQRLSIIDCEPSISSREYRGLVLPPSFKHISILHFQRNIIEAIPDAARLHSLLITCGCIELDIIQALGEKWGLGLRQLHFNFHIGPEEPDPSTEEIDVFALKFPHLDSLRYGYCGCSSSDEVSFSLPILL
jgi:hypothetical protein